METNSRRIVFAAVNSSFSHTMLSYGCLRAFTELHEPGWDWQYLESTINDDEIGFALRIAEAAPDIVCATAYLFNQDALLRITARVKALRPEVKIYLGGPQFLGDNAAFLRRHREIDAVIRGDESSFYRLLQGQPCEPIPGLCRLDAAGEYHDHGSAEFTGAPEELPSPYQLGYFPPGKPFYQLETARGCHGRCTFCTSGGSRLLLLPLERIRGDLAVLAAAGTTEIRVLDRTFNHGGERPRQLLRLFREEFPALRFHLEINPARLDADILAEITAFPAGSLHLEAGVQSLQPEVLKAVKRPANPEQTIDGLRQLQGCGNVDIHADLIAGLPEQTADTVFDDLRTLFRLGIAEIQLETLKVLPGTALAKQPPSGLIWNPEPPYEVLRTAAIPASTMQQLRVLSKIVDGYYNASPLRPAFTCLAVNDPGFLAEFLAFRSQTAEPLHKHSPQRRLEMLDDFAAATGRELLREVLRFIWLQQGFTPEKYGLKIGKCAEGLVPAQQIVWQAETFQPPARCCTAGFSCRIADLLNDARSYPSPQPTVYTFYFRHGQKSAFITEDT